MHFAKALESLGTNPRASCLPELGEFTHSAPIPERGDQASWSGQAPPSEASQISLLFSSESPGCTFTLGPTRINASFNVLWVPMDLKIQSVTKRASPSFQSVLDSGPPRLVTCDVPCI